MLPAQDLDGDRRAILKVALQNHHISIPLAQPRRIFVTATPIPIPISLILFLLVIFHFTTTTHVHFVVHITRAAAMTMFNRRCVFLRYDLGMVQKDKQVVQSRIETVRGLDNFAARGQEVLRHLGTNHLTFRETIDGKQDLVHWESERQSESAKESRV